MYQETLNTLYSCIYYYEMYNHHYDIFNDYETFIKEAAKTIIELK